MIIPVKVVPKTARVELKGRMQDLPTGKFQSMVYVDGKWRRLVGTRSRQKDCHGDIHKWAVDRGMWFDVQRMQVKGAVLK